MLLAPSACEGFGLPIAEAQACGCPVVTTNFSATAEILHNGQLIPATRKYFVPTGTFQRYVASEDVTPHMLIVYNRDEATVERDAQVGVEATNNLYSLEAVKPLWGEYLGCIEERLGK
jgi:glycosyltransferase involved in cell wall biosynthesis